jgi:hypothetical protein
MPIWQIGKLNACYAHIAMTTIRMMMDIACLSFIDVRMAGICFRLLTKRSFWDVERQGKCFLLAFRPALYRGTASRHSIVDFRRIRKLRKREKSSGLGRLKRRFLCHCGSTRPLNSSLIVLTE